MKKIISLLVVLAMLMAMAPAVFATGTGTQDDPFVYEVIGEIPTYFDLEAGQVIWIQAPVYGATVTLTNADEFAAIGALHPMFGTAQSIASTNGVGMATVVMDSNACPFFTGEIGDNLVFAIMNENPYTATSVGLSVSFDSGNGGGSGGAGTGAQDDPFVYEVIGDIPAYYDLEAGQVIWVQAPVYGATVTLTNADEFAAIGALHPMFGTAQSIASTNGVGMATVVMDSNACPFFTGEIGDNLVFAIMNENPYVATSVGLSVSYDSGIGGGGSGSTADGSYENPYVYEVIGEIPAYFDLDAAQTIWIQVPAYGATATLTNADEFAGISIMHPRTGQPAVIADCYGGSVTTVLDSSTTPFSGDVGDVIIIGITNQNPYVATSASLSLTFDSGSGGGIGGSEPNGTDSAPYEIESLEYPTDILVGEDMNATDIYYMYVAEKDGIIEITDATCETYITLNDIYSFNFDDVQTSIEVTTGDVVYFNICTSSPTGTYYATVGYQAPDPTAPITGTASAEEDSKFPVSYAATENGTLTITVGDGSAEWYSDVMDYSSFGIIASANGTAEGSYTCEVVAGNSYAIRFYGPGDPCAAIDGIPYSIVFTPDGTGSGGPQLEEFVEMTEEITEEGTYNLDVSADAETTLYTFRPSATGVYEIELVSGDVTMSEWSTIMYNKTAEAEDGVLTVTITAVGQSVFVGLSGEGTAQVKITKTGEADLEPDYDTIVYENEQTPIKFDDTLYVIGDNVNVDDEKVDTAVLGTDGYYHLNSADGPILYVDFFATEPSIGAAFGYGNVSYAQYDGDELVSVTNYQEALAEYMMAVNNEGNMSYGNKYHPLTADLIEILQNVGENNGWYGENGLVGDSEDAWMFSCITMVDTKFEIIEGGITTLPETLEEEGFESVEDVNNTLTEALLDADKDNDKENVEHYDVILMYKDGDEWVKADENHFPESGKLTVVIPYPEGTNKNYTFTVAHMFTSDAFEKTPGDIELPKVTNTDAGIQFEVTGLSPISVAWVAPAGNPEMGDPIVVAAAVALGVSSICGTALIAKKKKEF